MKRITIPDSKSQGLTEATVVGKPTATEQYEVLLIIRRNPAAPRLPSYEALGLPPVSKRKHLSRNEFAATYGADWADCDKVIAFAQDHQLNVVEINSGQRMITLSGTAAALEAAFMVELTQHDLPNGIHRGHLGDISLPADLADSVVWVFGLDDLPTGQATVRAEARLTPESTALTPVSYTSLEIAQLYNFPPALNGAGQCIGLIELDGGYQSSDIETYFEHLKLPQPEIINIGENKLSINPPHNLEVTLDIEVAGALAPAAKLAVYFAKEATTKGWYQVLAQAIHDTENKPTVLSISWSSPEAVAGLIDTGFSQAHAMLFNDLFHEAALLGVTVCCSSGDNGSNYPTGGRGANSALPVVHFPASSPWVLGCGGTTLLRGKDTDYEEVVWNRLAEKLLINLPPGIGTSQQIFSNGGASSGGVSDFFEQPDYQKAANIPPMISQVFEGNFSPQISHKHGRGVPDVAANADTNTGYTIFVFGQSLRGGGTSAATPLWAALIALINQALSQKSWASLGFVNPLFYQLQLVEKAEVVRLVTRGSNGAYTAQTNLEWNGCTGLGTPDGNKLLTALMSSGKL